MYLNTTRIYQEPYVLKKFTKTSIDITASSDAFDLKQMTAARYANECLPTMRKHYCLFGMLISQDWFLYCGVVVSMEISTLKCFIATACIVPVFPVMCMLGNSVWAIFCRIKEYEWNNEANGVEKIFCILRFPNYPTTTHPHPLKDSRKHDFYRFGAFCTI